MRIYIECSIVTFCSKFFRRSGFNPRVPWIFVSRYWFTICLFRQIVNSICELKGKLRFYYRNKSYFSPHSLHVQSFWLLWIMGMFCIWMLLQNAFSLWRLNCAPEQSGLHWVCKGFLAGSLIYKSLPGFVPTYLKVLFCKGQEVMSSLFIWFLSFARSLCRHQFGETSFYFCHLPAWNTLQTQVTQFNFTPFSALNIF